MLSERDRGILDLEARHWPHAGAKEAAIRDSLGGMSPTRYYQQLSALLDDPAALAYSPMVVRRLRRVRERARSLR